MIVIWRAARVGRPFLLYFRPAGRFFAHGAGELFRPDGRGRPSERYFCFLLYFSQVSLEASNFLPRAAKSNQKAPFFRRISPQLRGMRHSWDRFGGRGIWYAVTEIVLTSYGRVRRTPGASFVCTVSSCRAVPSCSVNVGESAICARLCISVESRHSLP